MVLQTESSTNVKETIADLKSIPTEEKLLEMLKEDILVVTFNKLDGDQRVMTCTKKYSFIPEEFHPKGETQTKPGLFNVYDVYAKGWRSFHYSRVTKIEKAVD